MFLYQKHRNNHPVTSSRHRFAMTDSCHPFDGWELLIPRLGRGGVCPVIHRGIFVLHKIVKDDIIYTIVKKGDFHMVRSVCRIFLIAGIVSVFSFGYVNDAVAAKGCNTVDAGRYCLKKDNKRPCPEGCWCESKKNVNAVADIKDYLTILL